MRDADGPLSARGTDLVQATVWGVYLHAQAGDALARRVGSLVFLARERLAEILTLTFNAPLPRP